MTDRERWIVYPLLLMALGLALQSKIMEPDARLGVVRCRQLVCDDAAVFKRAEVTVELDAARAKARILSAGLLTAGGASIDAVTSKNVSTQGLRVTDALGVRQAEIVSTPKGGRIDIERFDVGGDAPFEDRSLEIYVLDRQGRPIPLGKAELHLVAAEKPQPDRIESPLPKPDEAGAGDAAHAPTENGDATPPRDEKPAP